MAVDLEIFKAALEAGKPGYEAAQLAGSGAQTKSGLISHASQLKRRLQRSEGAKIVKKSDIAKMKDTRGLILNAMTPDKIAKASFSQLSVGLGILTDKLLLLEEKPNLIMRATIRPEIMTDAELADELRKRLPQPGADVA